MPKIITKDKKYLCQECQNSNDLSDGENQLRDIVECKFCGMEYTIVGGNADTEYELEELVEKK